MIAFDSVVGFDLDAGNARKNAKHGVTQTEAEEVFLHRLLVLAPDVVRRSASEPRFYALGIAREGRRLHLTFTLRGSGTLIRVISARDMHRKKKAIYEKAE